MGEVKAKRGRPRIKTIPTGFNMSRRREVNTMYMYSAVGLISEAAAEIPNQELLWYADDETKTARGKNGVLEQIGRMLEQDHYSEEDCIYIANLAAQASASGYTSREIENAIRRIRMAYKRLSNDPDDPALQYQEGLALQALIDMSRSKARVISVAATENQNLSVKSSNR